MRAIAMVYIRFALASVYVRFSKRQVISSRIHFRPADRHLTNGRTSVNSFRARFGQRVTICVLRLSPDVFYAVRPMDEIGKTAKTDRLVRECCPVCSGRNLTRERKIRDHIDHAWYTVTCCRDCSLRFVSDPPPQSDIQQHYANTAGIGMHKQGSGLHYRLRNLLLKDELKPLARKMPAGSEIIDYGSGDGAVSKVLQSMGYKVSAIDMYPPSEWPYPEIEYTQTDINMPIPPIRIPGGEKIARAAVMRHLLEHLYEPTRVISSIRDANAQYILIIAPNYRSIMRPFLGEYWYYWDPPRHLMYFTEKSLYCLAERCGYKLIETATYAVDEAVTSLHRGMLLASRQTELTRKMTKLTDPKSPLAAVSSCVASFFGNCVIHALFEKYKPF